MRALVLGAGGGLGQTFQSQGNKIVQNYDWVFSNRQDLDVTNHVAVGFKLDFVKPQIVINASGYTAVDKAEEEKDIAFQVNAAAVGNLAEQCHRRGILFVTYSTDYVFSGDSGLPHKEKDPTDPINVYGQSKLAGEELALPFETSIVIRTSWLYSASGKSFPKTILEKTIRGEPLKIVNDQFSSPTYSNDLIRATFQLIESGQKGLFHYSCSGTTNWHEYACQTIEFYNELKKTNLPLPQAITSEEFPTRARRPKYSTLNCDRIRKRGVLCRPWRRSLQEFVDHIIRLGV